MSQQTLEERVAALEQAMSALQTQQKKQSVLEWLRNRPPLTPEMEQAFLEMEAYGQYYRQTGKDPPPDWKPGDPIPEADEEWCPR